MDALPTMVNLQKRGIGISDLCPCCGLESKTLFHSIIKCEVAKRVWDNWEGSSVENWQGLMDISDVALDILKNGTNCDLEVFFGVAWSVWYNRNQVAFKSKCQLPGQIWRFARSFLQDCKGALCDGATSEDRRNSSVGAVIRDSCDAVLAACSIFLRGQFSVEEVEALAMEVGILLA